MATNQLDFVLPGTRAGQVVEVAGITGFDHTDDIGTELPGVDTEIRLSGHPFDYRVRALETPEGPQLVELHIDSPDHDVPITPEDLRKLARYLDRLAYVAANPAAMFALANSERFHEPEKRRPKRPGRRGNGDDFYSEIAGFAKRAHGRRQWTGISVEQAIADEYQVTRSCAAGWLKKARARGFLISGELGGTPKRQNRSTKDTLTIKGERPE